MTESKHSPSFRVFRLEAFLFAFYALLFGTVSQAIWFFFSQRDPLAWPFLPPAGAMTFAGLTYLFPAAGMLLRQAWGFRLSLIVFSLHLALIAVQWPFSTIDWRYAFFCGVGVIGSLHLLSELQRKKKAEG